MTLGDKPKFFNSALHKPNQDAKLGHAWTILRERHSADFVDRHKRVLELLKQATAQGSCEAIDELTCAAKLLGEMKEDGKIEYLVARADRWETLALGARAFTLGV